MKKLTKLEKLRSQALLKELHGPVQYQIQALRAAVRDDPWLILTPEITAWCAIPGHYRAIMAITEAEKRDAEYDRQRRAAGPYWPEYDNTDGVHFTIPEGVMGGPGRGKSAMINDLPKHIRNRVVKIKVKKPKHKHWAGFMRRDEM